MRVWHEYTLLAQETDDEDLGRCRVDVVVVVVVVVEAASDPRLLLEDVLSAKYRLHLTFTQHRNL